MIKLLIHHDNNKQLFYLTSTKFVHSCVIQTKSILFKQSLTKTNKVKKSLESIKVPYNSLETIKVPKNPLKSLEIH